MKNQYLKYSIIVAVFCVSVWFCLKNEPTRSLFLSTQIDTVIVVNEGEKYREQEVEFHHNYKGEIYIRKVTVDTLLRRFYNIGDTMIVSYIKDDPNTISYHNISVLGSIPFIFLSLFTFVILTFDLYSYIRSKTKP